MKLELKHLAIAFTNNLKVTYFDDERELNQVCNIVELREDECTISNGEYEYDVKFDDIKLLCFPISSLTKEITVNGESFVPVDIICPKEDYKKEFDRKVAIGSIEIQGAINFSCTAFCIVEKLFELKFDVFGLIEGGLAEPVTEDFNPYK